MDTQNLHDVMVAISEKLDGILAFMVAKDCDGDAAKIVSKLKPMGMNNKTIALVAGISENAVAIRATRLKKTSSKGRKKGAKKSPPPPASEGNGAIVDSGI